MRQMDTIDWLCKQLNISRNVLLSPSRDNYTVVKRRIAVLFLHHYGKGVTWIGETLNRHWTTIINSLYTAKEYETKVAKELTEAYSKSLEGCKIRDVVTQSKKKYDIVEITMEVCEHYGCSLKDVKSPCRTKHIMAAKKTLYYLFRKCGMKFREIGQLLNKDHQSVLTTLEKLNDPEIIEYANDIYDIYCSDSCSEKIHNILDLLNKGKTVKEIYNITGYSRDFIKKRIKKFGVKKVPNYQTSEITTKYFLK